VPARGAFDGMAKRHQRPEYDDRMAARARNGIGVPRRRCVSITSLMDASIAKAATFGMGPAKNVCQVDGVGGYDETMLKNQLEHKHMAMAARSR
jgi:hypothetical protein